MKSLTINLKRLINTKAKELSARTSVLFLALLLVSIYLIVIPLGLVHEDHRIEWEDILLLVVLLFFMSDLPKQLRQFTLGRESLTAEFEQLTQKVEEQNRTISDIQFLLNSLVTRYEYEKLTGLRSEGHFLVRYRSELDAELRRLRALGFVRNHEGTSLQTMRREQAGRNEEYDLKRYFYITDRGKEYLERRGLSESQGGTPVL